MDGNDRGKDAPSLEPPSLFGRRRRRKEQSEAGPDSADRPSGPAPQAVAAPVREPVEDPAPEPITGPITGPVGEPAPETAAQPVPEPSETTPLFADEVPVEEDAEAAAASQEPSAGATRVRPRRPRRVRTRQRRTSRGPRTISGVPGMVAACLTGLVVGLGTVLLTWAALGLCEVATGTSSCGDPGFFLLVAVLVVMTLVGSALLRLFGLTDTGSTSFLAVGLLAVLILVFLVDVLFSWTMVVVIPLLAVGTYAASHWITVNVTDTD